MAEADLPQEPEQTEPEDPETEAHRLTSETEAEEDVEAHGGKIPAPGPVPPVIE